MKFDSQGRVIGCGYCVHEKTCSIHDPKINRAMLGCDSYLHHEDAKNLKNNEQFTRNNK